MINASIYIQYLSSNYWPQDYGQDSDQDSDQDQKSTAQDLVSRDWYRVHGSGTNAPQVRMALNVSVKQQPPLR